MDEPFEMPYKIVVARLNDSELAQAKTNFAEGVAITEKAKGEQWTGEKKVETIQNPDLNSCHNIVPHSFFESNPLIN